MAKLFKKRSTKAGLPPGTLVHIGEKKAESVKLNIMTYNETSFEEKEVMTPKEGLRFKDKSGVVWINVDSVHQTEVIKELGNAFGLHPLIQEDILNTDQRPKIEDFEDYVYIVLKMLSPKNQTQSIQVEQVSLILTSDTVISFQEGIRGDVFDPVRQNIRNNKGPIRKMKADYLAYSLLDTVIDNYFIILENFEEKTEQLEKELVVNPSSQVLQTIHALKKELIILRKSVWPLREVLNTLSQERSSLISQSTRMYLRDIYDHAIQIIEVIEIFRELLSEMLEIYLSSINNKISSVMKVFTVIATIFIPLTFIASIYGMNFQHMPELAWKWGYPMTLGIMVFVGILMVNYFKKRDWL